MEKTVIDARGKDCPLPVIETKTFIDNANTSIILEVIVDNKIAVENLLKLTTKRNLEASFIQQDKSVYIVTIKVEKNINNNITTRDNIIVVIDTNILGTGDEQLGDLLMKGYIYALTELETLPNSIILYNKGVFLSTSIPETIADLKILETKGVEVLSCGTCLMHYDVDTKLSVGKVTNMYEIVEKQFQATKVIKL